MPYLRHTYTKNVSVVYLEFRFDWVSYIFIFQNWKPRKRSKIYTSITLTFSPRHLQNYWKKTEKEIIILWCVLGLFNALSVYQLKYQSGKIPLGLRVPDFVKHCLKTWMENRMRRDLFSDHPGPSVAKIGICAFEDTNWSHFCIPGGNLNPCGNHKGGFRQDENGRWVGKSSSN